MKILDRHNGNRFIPYDLEEKSALQLIYKLIKNFNLSVDEIEEINNNLDTKVSFTDMKEKYLLDNGDYKGSWFGIDRPEYADSTQGAVLKQHTDKIDILEKKVGDTFKNPLEYGCKFDGVTDDTINLQKVVSLGGIIIFPSNRQIVLSNTISIPSNTTIDLNGCEILYNNKSNYSSVFRNEGYVDLPIRYMNENITIKNGIINGQNNKCWAMKYHGVKHLKIVNMKVFNTAGFHSLLSCLYVLVSNCHAENVSEDVFSVSDSGAMIKSKYLRFENCFATECCTTNTQGNNSTRNVFEFDDGPTHITYENCKAINNYGLGFTMHIHDTEANLTVRNIIYSNCESTNNNRSGGTTDRQVGGFNIGQVPSGCSIENIVYSNCVSYGNRQFGFSTQSGSQNGYRSNIKITNCTFEVVGTNKDLYTSCINIGKNFKDVLIENNTLIGNSVSNGIYSYGTASGLVIENNRILSGTPLNLNHNGTYTIISNNKIEPVYANNENIIKVRDNIVKIKNNNFLVSTIDKFNGNLIDLNGCTRIIVEGNLFNNNTPTYDLPLFTINSSTSLLLSNNIFTGWETLVNVTEKEKTRVLVTGNLVTGCSNFIIGEVEEYLENGNL